jgi:hypothetical protein
MDLNRFPIPLILVALQVQYVCRSKIELRNTIVRDREECIYQYLYLREDYIEFLLFFQQDEWRSIWSEYGDGRYMASTIRTVTGE